MFFFTQYILPLYNRIPLNMKNLFIPLICTSLLAAICFSCRNNDNSSKPQSGYLLVFGEDSCRCIDYDDNAIFTLANNEISLYYNDVALLYNAQEGKWGYISQKGETVLPFIYDKATVFSEGLAWTQKNGSAPNAINHKGDVKISLRDAHEVRAFHQGHAAFSTIKKKTIYWGFINKEGEEVIKAQYRNVQNFHYGMAAIQESTTGLWGYIDLSGNVTITPQYSKISTFDDNGHAIVCNNESYYLIDATGAELAHLYCNNAITDDNLIMIERDNLWGWCDHTGKETIVPQYETIRPFGSASVAPVKIKGKWAYIDRNGEIAIKRQFTDAYPFVDGYAAVKAGSLWGFINEKGTYVINPQYEQVPKDYLQQALKQGSAYSSLLIAN